MENENKKMTVFYQKSTGRITNMTEYATDIEHHFVTPEDVADYSLIWDYIVVDYNDTVFFNPRLFKVVDKKIILRDDLSDFM